MSQVTPEIKALNLPAGGDPIAIGRLAGWASAGDVRAQQAISGLTDQEQELADSLVEALGAMELGPSFDVLRLAREAETAVDSIPQDARP